MAKFLSQDQINEYKECFSLYDKQQRGKIKATDLIVVMRCLGASPTPGEVQRHLQTHKIGEWAEPGWGRSGLAWWVGLEPAAVVLGKSPQWVQRADVRTGQRLGMLVAVRGLQPGAVEAFGQVCCASLRFPESSQQW